MLRTAIAMSIIAAASSAAFADTVKIEQNGFSAGNGGQFTITPQTGYAGLTGLASDLGPNSFETFCVEHNENFRPGDTYDFVINTGAVQGGVSGQTSPGFDPLDERTAFLYTHFRAGDLVGFDYGAGRQASAGDLQDAIWYIEGEGGANNAFVALAETAIANQEWWGIGDVRVLNLSNNEFPNAQDQLTIIPAPGAAVLLGLGAMGLRRRR